MEFVALLKVLSNIMFVMFAGVFITALGFFFFDRSPRAKSADLKLVERERRVA